VLIVIEGTDGTGKSTLANELGRRVLETRPNERVEVIHFGPPKLHPLTEYEHVVDVYRPGQGRTIICDRLHWGEMVYSEIYRNGSQLGPWGFWHVEQALAARGALIIWADGDEARIRERQSQLGEDFLQPEHALEVQAAFERVALEESTLGSVRFDSTVPVEEQWESDELLSLAGALEVLTPDDPARWPSYVGCRAPTLLLVGEAPNYSAANRPRGHVAAFVPYPESSGRYLLEQVVLPLPLEEQRLVGLVNAYNEPSGEVTQLRELWHVLGRPDVVALGNKARDQLEAQSVPHRHAPHPQYWRRFHHREGAAYRELVLGRRVF
jgi:thymidylate kinase